MITKTMLALGTSGALATVATQTTTLHLPDLAGFGASGVAIALLIWIVREEKEERIRARKEFSDALKDHSAAIKDLATKIEKWGA